MAALTAPAVVAPRGCSHYQRGCKLVAPCCGEEFVCRLCHDEKHYENQLDPEKAHKLVRGDVKEVVCATCATQQAAESQACTKCGATFGHAYFCVKCRLWDDVDKGQFHCDACGLCRAGGPENYEHCEACGMCFQIGHVCPVVRKGLFGVKNALRSDCPICMEDLFTSRASAMTMPCGHGIHFACFEQLCKSSSRCPLCSQSLFARQDLAEWTAALDVEIANTPMPEEYRDLRVKIMCNDCLHESETPWHIFGLKCRAPLNVSGSLSRDEGASKDTVDGAGKDGDGDDNSNGDSNSDGNSDRDMSLVAAALEAVNAGVEICGSYNTRRI